MEEEWGTEETYPKASSLTLTGITKGPKIVEVAREPDKEENEQVGMEQILEESQLPVEDGMHNKRSPLIPSPPDVRKNSSEPTKFSRSNQGNAKIMEMLVSMKKEMEEREKRWEQQQKIREEFLEANFRRREQQWEQMLKQRDEEWKKEIERRERALLQRLYSKVNTFYNEQLKRDEDVLTFLEKREEKIEASMLQNAEGFKYLYKEQFKEFGKIMEKRDNELEMDNNYRHKLWNASLNQVNSNLLNIHIVITELKGFVNNLAHRQDQLVTLVEYTNEYFLFQREEPPAKEKPDISIPKFPPSLATFNLEPQNMKTSKSYKRRR